MSTAMLIELFGYLGSTMVVVSMLMSSVVKLRVINTIGSVISGTYALIIGSFPLALMNFCLIVINVYNLYKLLNTKVSYEMINTNSEDAYLKYFVEHYRQDIALYFPQFVMKEAYYDVAYIICCNEEPAGVVLGKYLGDGEIKVSMEYTTPAYRDCSVGKYLYSEFSKKGVKKLIFSDKAQNHVSYMEKMGYIKSGNDYVKEF